MLHKSPGPDGIHPKVLEELAEQVSPVPTRLYDGSLERENLTKELKKAAMIPLFKDGGKSQADNYRPANLTCIAGKFIQQLFLIRIRKFL